jgi:hypothetical protein
LQTIDTASNVDTGKIDNAAVSWRKHRGVDFISIEEGYQNQHFFTESSVNDYRLVFALDLHMLPYPNGLAFVRDVCISKRRVRASAMIDIPTSLLEYRLNDAMLNSESEESTVPSRVEM